jgi:NADH-ubiquinone oxidoreductase chain 6
VFVGGILVLFIYVASLASNEIFTLSTKIIVASGLAIAISTIIRSKPLPDRRDSTTHNTTRNEIILITRKLYNQPRGIITILIALYLLITLIVVVKITNVSKGPLRQTA